MRQANRPEVGTAERQRGAERLPLPHHHVGALAARGVQQPGRHRVGRRPAGAPRGGRPRPGPRPRPRGTRGSWATRPAGRRAPRFPRLRPPAQSVTPSTSGTSTRRWPVPAAKVASTARQWGWRPPLTHTVWRPGAGRGQVDRLDRGAGPVVERGVGHGQAGQPGDHGLVLEQRLQHALGHLGLVGRVGGDELGAEGQSPGGRRDLVVVGARPGEADQVGAGGGVAGGQPLHLDQHVGLGQPRRQVEAAGQPQRGRHALEQLVERRQADEGEHGRQLRRRCGGRSDPSAQAPFFLATNGNGTTTGRLRPAPHVELDGLARLDVRRQEGQGDAVAEDRGEVAAGDLAHRLAADQHGVALPGRLAALGGQPAQPAGHAPLPLGGQRGPAPEARRLVPGHHPAQAGLQRGDARAQLVAVEGQGRLQPQGVPGAEPGRVRCRRRARPSQNASAAVAGTAHSTPSSPV